MSANVFVDIGGTSNQSATASLALTASLAVTASYSITNVFTQSVTSSTNFQTSSFFSGSVTFPLGLVVTGSVTASNFSGSFIGDGTKITNIQTSSFALTASYSVAEGPVPFVNITGVPTGIVSSSAQTIANLPIGTVSSSLQTIANLAGTNIVSSSIQFSTGSYTGSFIGDGTLIINVPSASAATHVPFGGISGLPSLVSSSTQINNTPSSSYALTASYALNGGGGGGGISNTGSFTGSFTGLFNGNISNANSASYFSGSVTFPSGLSVTGTLQANAFTGDGTNIVNVITASYSNTSSYALNAGAATPASSSYAFNATTASFASFSANGLSSSYAQFASTASYFSSSVTFPLGLTVTGSYSSSNGGFVALTPGYGLTFKGGTNPKAGTASLSSGVAVIVTNAFQSSSIVSITRITNAGTLGNLSYVPSASYGFTVNSTSIIETSLFNWVIFDIV